MPTSPPNKLRFARGSQYLNDTYTGLAGELTIDMDRWRLRIHDGLKRGGYALANYEETLKLNESMNEKVNRLIGRISHLETLLDVPVTNTPIDPEITVLEQSIVSMQNQLNTLFVKIDAINNALINLSNPPGNIPITLESTQQLVETTSTELQTLLDRVNAALANIDALLNA